MWIRQTDDTETLNSSDCFRMLEYHQRAEWHALDLYAHHLNIQVAFISALLAGGVAALVIQSIAAKLLTAAIPLLMVALRRYSIESLDRAYQRFLEAAACSRKLEWMLQLDQPLSVREVDTIRSALFPQDKTLDVSRRWRKGAPGTLTSAQWIADRMGRGRNDVTWRLLRIMFLAALAIPVAAWVMLLGENASWNILIPWVSALGILIVVIDLSCIALYRLHSVSIWERRREEQALLPSGRSRRCNRSAKKLPEIIEDLQSALEELQAISDDLAQTPGAGDRGLP